MHKCPGAGDSGPDLSVHWLYLAGPAAFPAGVTACHTQRPFLGHRWLAATTPPWTTVSDATAGFCAQSGGGGRPWHTWALILTCVTRTFACMAVAWGSMWVRCERSGRGCGACTHSPTCGAASSPGQLTRTDLPTAWPGSPGDGAVSQDRGMGSMSSLPCSCSPQPSTAPFLPTTPSCAAVCSTWPGLHTSQQLWGANSFDHCLPVSLGEQGLVSHILSNGRVGPGPLPREPAVTSGWWPCSC